MKKVLIFIVWTVGLNGALAADYMSADQVRQHFNDKTFDVVFLPKQISFSAYTSADGALKVVRSKGKTDPPRTWFVKGDGKRCVTHPKWKNHKKWANGRCGWVKDAGNGAIHQFSLDGKHTHTFTNFRDGDQT